MRVLDSFHSSWTSEFSSVLTQGYDFSINDQEHHSGTAILAVGRTVGSGPRIKRREKTTTQWKRHL